MAKKIAPKESSAKARGGIKPSDLKRVVTDILRHKSHASENAGLAGKATASACETYGLDKGGLSFVVSLSRMEAGKRGSKLRAALDYAEKLGYFDEVDMFDDTLNTLRDILKRAEEKAAAGPEVEPAVKSLLDGGTPAGTGLN